MKTVNEITVLIDQAIAFVKNLKEDDPNYLKKSKAKRKEITFLRMCKMYLETNLREEFLKNDLNTINTNIGIISNRFSTWFDKKKQALFNGDVNKAKRVYLTEMNVPKMKAQVKTLKFILS